MCVFFLFVLLLLLLLASLGNLRGTCRRCGTRVQLISSHEITKFAWTIAEVLIAKQRHGPIGKVELQFTGEFTRFSNLERGLMGEE